eukprot:g8433.t1
MIPAASPAAPFDQALANKRNKAHQDHHHRHQHQHQHPGPNFALHDMADSIADVEKHCKHQRRSPAEAVEGAAANTPCTGTSASASASAPALDHNATSRPMDLRLQIQASKLAFIVSKRRQELIQVGFALRREERNAGATANTIQEFLDRTWAARHVSGHGLNPRDLLLGSAGSLDAPPAIGYGRNGADGGVAGSGGGARGLGSVESPGGFEEWRGMTFVFCEELGWVFLHQASEAAVEVVRAIFSSIHCQEMGVLLADPVNKATIEGLASAFESSNDVSIRFDGAIAKIAGTEPQVFHVARAIEAIDSSAQRIHTAAHWYFQGHVLSGDADYPPPWFPMDADANRGLEEAFLRRGEGEVDGKVYQAGGVSYHANFTLMTQSNASTGFVRPIKRVITDRRSYPLPRCPQRNMPLMGLREGATVSLVKVSQEEDRMVRAAVSFSYQDSTVVKVQHVWNSFLWDHYAQNAKSIGNECMLFHGANSEAISTILRTGFEKRLAGSANGANYGQGCYFARDACLAARYMNPPPHGGQMIMAKVLVGEYIKGDKHMVIPPKVPRSERHYDSTSNSDHSPALIVTYKDWQAYPMYLITFAPRP